MPVTARDSRTEYNSQWHCGSTRLARHHATIACPYSFGCALSVARHPTIRCSWLNDSMSNLKCALDLARTHLQEQLCSSFTVSLFHPVAARLPFRELKHRGIVRPVHRAATGPWTPASRVGG